MTPIRQMTLLAAVVALLLVASISGVARASTGAVSGKVVTVEVTGPDVVAAERLKMALKTRVGTDYDPAVVDQDIKYLYSRNLVDDVQVFVEQVEGGVKVVFRVVEKRLISGVDFRPEDAYFNAGDLRPEILAKPEENYSFAISAQDEEIIAKKFRDKGFLKVKVTHNIEESPNGLVLVYFVEQGQRYAIGEFVFTGNTVFTSKRIRKEMKTKQRSFFHGGMYIEENIQMDLEVIRRMYQDEGYLDAQVTIPAFTLPEPPDGYDPEKKLNFELRIDITEGVQYMVSSVEYTGETVFGRPELEALTAIRAGEVASYREVLRTVQNIRDEFGELGRAFTDVKPEMLPTGEPGMVDIIFHIRQSGVVFVQEIIVQGNDVTREHVIRRELDIYPGEELTVRGLRNSMNNLRRLDYFSDVSLSFEPRNDELTDVVVSVTEGKTGNLLLGGGVSSDGDVFVRVSYTERNFDISNWPTFRGGGQEFRASVNLGSSMNQFMVDFLEPHVFDSKYSFGIGAFRSEYDRTTYDDTRVGGHILVGRRLSRTTSVSLVYTYQHVTIDDIDTTAPTSVKLDEGKHDLGSLSLRLNYRDIDDPYFPSWGWDTNGEVEYFNEMLGSDYDFYKITLKAARYINLYTTETGNKHTLMARMTVGYMDAVGDTAYIPTFERFYAGGINTVRGWAPREVGPKESGDPIGGYFRTCATLEYSFPLYAETLYMAAFFDAGGVWPEMSDFDTSDLRYGTGLGVYIRTPITPMPIRIYYTHALNEEDDEDTQSIQFSFGFIF